MWSAIITFFTDTHMHKKLAHNMSMETSKVKFLITGMEDVTRAHTHTHTHRHCQHLFVAHDAISNMKQGIWILQNPTVKVSCWDGNFPGKSQGV